MILVVGFQSYAAIQDEVETIRRVALSENELILCETDLEREGSQDAQLFLQHAFEKWLVGDQLITSFDLRWNRAGRVRLIVRVRVAFLCFHRLETSSDATLQSTTQLLPNLSRLLMATVGSIRMKRLAKIWRDFAKIWKDLSPEQGYEERKEST